MLEIIKKSIVANKMGKLLEVPTNRLVNCTIVRSKCHILEMEDVLFHLNSAVLMPENPENTSSGNASEKQLKVSGVRALTLVFRKFQDTPNKSILVCGHADRSGQVQYNFELSGMRAKNVLFIIQGRRSDWAEICANKHRIEDFQQITQYYALMNSWNCDPGKIDNVWGEKTKKAMDGFIENYNDHFFNKPSMSFLDPELVENVDKDSKHEWSKEMWEAVYDLYENDLILTTCNGKDAKKNFNKLRSKIQFVDLNKPFIACGESFPKDKRSGIPYRSQKDRRVEILFFDKNETPSITCPNRTTSVHIDDECPFWSDKTFKFEYIPAEEFFTASYHLKFEYFDKIKQEFLSVPEGLNIKTWKESFVCLNSKVSCENGVYKIIVLEITNSPREDDIHFTFETNEQLYLFTKDDSSDPVIISNTELERILLEERNNLSTDHQSNAPVNFSQLPFNRKRHYYDLPMKWDSRNWQCFISGNVNDFAVNNVKITEINSPLTFNLDSIVLVDENDSQKINDKNENDNIISLDNNSRISLLYVENENLILHDPERSDAPFFSAMPFNKNFVVNVPGNACVVIFSNDFYCVSNKRSGQEENFDPTLLHRPVCGCRAAKLKDQECYHGMKLKYENSQNNPFPYYAKDTGNFELHYIHNCAIMKDEGDVQRDMSFCIIYWSARFIDDTKSFGGSNDPITITQNHINNFSFQGMRNAKNRWENKGYLIKPQDDSDSLNITIKPTVFFETKKENNGGRHKCLISITNDSSAGSMGIDTSEMYYQDYKDRDYLGVGTFIDIDGKNYDTLVVAHEYGHATGKDDEYSYDDQFDQYYPGMPYQIDTGSMMLDNRAPRIKQFWFFVNRINDGARKADELQLFLKNNQFKIVHSYSKSDGTQKKLDYYLESKYRDIYTPFKPQLNESNIHNVGTGNVGVALYKLGEDEAAWNIMINGSSTAFAFNGIFVSYFNLGFTFIDDVDGIWDVDYDKEDWMQQVRDELTLLNNSYYLEHGGTNHDFQRTYMFFYPVCIENPASAGHYSITVRFKKHTYVINKGGSVINLGFDADPVWVAKYILGTDSTHPEITDPPEQPINATTLQPLRDWFRINIGNNNFKIIG